MAQNLIQDGDVMPVVLSGTVTSGSAIVVGDTVGVALNSGVSGETIQVAICGVYELPKASGAISQGAVLYWDAANSNLTTTASTHKKAGIAFLDAASGDATVQLKLLY